RDHGDGHGPERFDARGDAALPGGVPPEKGEQPRVAGAAHAPTITEDARSRRILRRRAPAARRATLARASTRPVDLLADRGRGFAEIGLSVCSRSRMVPFSYGPNLAGGAAARVRPRAAALFVVVTGGAIPYVSAAAVRRSHDETVG